MNKNFFTSLVLTSICSINAYSQVVNGHPYISSNNLYPKNGERCRIDLGCEDGSYCMQVNYKQEVYFSDRSLELAGRCEPKESLINIGRVLLNEDLKKSILKINAKTAPATLYSAIRINESKIYHMPNDDMFDSKSYRNTPLVVFELGDGQQAVYEINHFVGRNVHAKPLTSKNTDLGEMLYSAFDSAKLLKPEFINTNMDPFLGDGPGITSEMDHGNYLGHVSLNAADTFPIKLRPEVPSPFPRAEDGYDNGGRSLGGSLTYSNQSKFNRFIVPNGHLALKDTFECTEVNRINFLNKLKAVDDLLFQDVIFWNRGFSKSSANLKGDEMYNNKSPVSADASKRCHVNIVVAKFSETQALNNIEKLGLDVDYAGTSSYMEFYQSGESLEVKSHQGWVKEYYNNDNSVNYYEVRKL